MQYENEFLSRSRQIQASPHEVFELLRHPERHHETEPGDWVRAAIDPEPISQVGQIFAVHMYAEGAGGPYIMHNTVTVFEPDQVIAWDPGQPDEQGVVRPGGWRWRYELTPAEGGTTVTLIYDWSAVSAEIRELFGGFPVVDEDFLDRSLAALERAVLSED